MRCKAGVARPVARGGAPPVVRRVVVVAEQVREDRRWDRRSERKQRAHARGADLDPELAQTAAEALRAQVRAGLRSGEQPRSFGLCVLPLDEACEWWWQFDRLVADLEQDGFVLEVDRIDA